MPLLASCNINIAREAQSRTRLTARAEQICLVALPFHLNIAFPTSTILSITDIDTSIANIRDSRIAVRYSVTQVDTYLPTRLTMGTPNPFENDLPPRDPGALCEFLSSGSLTMNRASLATRMEACFRRPLWETSLQLQR